MTFTANNIDDIRSHLNYINGKINSDHTLLIQFILSNTYKANRHNLVSYSQLGQDNMVYDMFDCERCLTYVDIGASHPIQLSNSYGIETQLGWNGVLVEYDKEMRELHRNTRSGSVYNDPFMIANGISNINEILSLTGKDFIDYISIDIDGGEYDVLRTIDHGRFKFSIIDVEHDIYKTNALHKRNAIAMLLEERGYTYFRSVGVDDIFILNSDAARLGQRFNQEYGYDIRDILPYQSSNLIM